MWTKRKQIFVLAVLVCAQCCLWIKWNELKNYASTLYEKQPELGTVHDQTNVVRRSELQAVALQSARKPKATEVEKPSKPEVRIPELANSSDILMVVGIVTAERNPPTAFKMVRMLVDKLDFKRFQVSETTTQIRFIFLIHKCYNICTSCLMSEFWCTGHILHYFFFTV